MQVVILQDVVAGYGSNWSRVANTEGLYTVKIGDHFREQGFGDGSEELKVAGIDLSPVGGLSRLYFERGANNTTPQVHRLGCTLEPVHSLADVTSEEKQELVGSALTNVSAATSITNQPLNGLSELEDFPEPQNLTAVRPPNWKTANAVRQKRWREKKKLADSQHD